MNDRLIEGKDFYYNDDGNMVLTKEYLLKRGHCCHSGCKHCPYEIAERFDPSIPQELQCKNDEEEVEVYDGEIDPEFDL